MNSIGKYSYFIRTYGCAANVSDSERIASRYHARGYRAVTEWKRANDIVINTCMIRQSAENRVYGFVRNIVKENQKRRTRKIKIILTGCMVGMAVRDQSGKFMKALRKKLPFVDEFMPIEEVGFDHAPLRSSNSSACVPISNGCNNYCTFCVVPHTRGREISRPFGQIVQECTKLIEKGYTHITLLGQNVNSYGADLILGSNNPQKIRDIEGLRYFPETGVLEYKDRLHDHDGIAPTYVKHLGRMRIPTLFPALLSAVSSISPRVTIDFLSSNPWDFSDDLIDVIAKYPNITRMIHLPVQSGDAEMLKKMNRWYTPEEYLHLVQTMRRRIPGVQFSTDIIVGYCGETDEQFQNTRLLCQNVGFSKAYIAMYSDRPGTAGHTAYVDDVPYRVKKKRWTILENLINAQYHTDAGKKSVRK